MKQLHTPEQVAYARKIYESSLAKVVKLLGRKGLYRLYLSVVGSIDFVRSARTTSPEDGTFVLRVLGGGEPPRFGHFNLLGKWQLGVAKSFKLDVARLYAAKSLADLEQLALTTGSEEDEAVSTADPALEKTAATTGGGGKEGKKKNRKKRKQQRRKKNRRNIMSDSDDTSSISTDTCSANSSPSFTSSLSPSSSPGYSPVTAKHALALFALDANNDEVDEDETAFARDALKLTAAITKQDVVSGGEVDGRNARQRVLDLEARFGKLPASGVASAMKESMRQAMEEENKQKQRTEIFQSISTNLFDDYVLEEKRRMEREAKAGVGSRYPCAAASGGSSSSRRIIRTLSSSSSSALLSKSPPLKCTYPLSSSSSS
jgi:hypothetical protein